MMISSNTLSEAKSYQRKKQKLVLTDLFLKPVILFLIAYLPVSSYFKSAALTGEVSLAVSLAIYFLLFSAATFVIDLPLTVYSGFILEREYHLSNQKLSSWLIELFKKTGLGFVLSLVLIEALYHLIYFSPDRWWLYAWLGYGFFSYLIGKIFPVFIVPIFYKYSEIPQGDLKERILKLVQRFQTPVKAIYSLNLSKTTKKANAAFMGIGKTKRVVLSDTLISNFTPDEIEAVVAHELGHCIHRDVWRHLSFGMVCSLILFWMAFHYAGPVIQWFGYSGVTDLAAMPVLFLIFMAVGMVLMPAQNAFSRYLERGADAFALKAYPDKKAFISCMEKLGALNLADPSPHPVYEWFFYDHPAIYRRIEMAKRQA